MGVRWLQCRVAVIALLAGLALSIGTAGAQAQVDTSYDPTRREAYWTQGKLGDDGTVRASALFEAAQAVARLRREKASCQGLVAGVPVGETVNIAKLATSRAPTGEWNSLGPFSAGGRTRAIVFDPRIPDQMWAASVGGGIWYSANGGTNWEAKSEGLTHTIVAALAIDPTEPSTIYAGTGESFTGTRPGAGLFWRKGEGPWQRIASTKPDSEGDDFSYVNRISVSPDGKILLVATKQGIFRNDGRRADGSADPDRSVWIRVAGGAFSTVLFHPRDPMRAIAGGQQEGEALYTQDGGVQWHQARTGAPWQGRVELAYAAQNPELVYASINLARGQVWRSTDGGRSFSPRETRTAR